MNPTDYLNLKDELIELGHAEDIDWSVDIKPCKRAEDFASEYIGVVLNSGMKNQIAKQILIKVSMAIRGNNPVNSVFHHPSKSAAIQEVWDHKEKYFDGWL